MFIETQSYKEIKLAFVKSTAIRAYPCGRRRALVDKNQSLEDLKPSEQYYIPLDPEARLNTEANNRKYSSLNGFTQTYLNTWNEDSENGELSLVLSGYQFNIKLDTIKTPTEVANAVLTQLKTANADKIYANITIENVKLFAGHNQEYFTGVLRNQTDAAASPSTSLDLLKSVPPQQEAPNPDDAKSYYFSGLSFSTEPITQVMDTRSSIGTFRESGTDKIKQLNVSLCILEKTEEGTWQIHQKALLPVINHGAAENSVEIPGTFDATTVKQNGEPVSVLSVKEDKTLGTWQLQFHFDTAN